MLRLSRSGSINEFIQYAFRPGLLPGHFFFASQCRGHHRIEELRMKAHGVGCTVTPVPACSSIRSQALTGTRSSRPILMVGISPRAAAAYEAFRESAKYRFPASGTVKVAQVAPKFSLMGKYPLVRYGLRNTNYIVIMPELTVKV